MFENMQRESASLKIQKNLRGRLAWKSYKNLQNAVISVQTGIRAMAARKTFRYKNQNKAAIIIQVSY